MNALSIRRPRHLWPEIAGVTRPLMECCMESAGIFSGSLYLLMAQTREDGSGLGAAGRHTPCHSELTAEEIQTLRLRLRAIQVPLLTVERETILWPHHGCWGGLRICDGEQEAMVRWQASEPEGWSQVFQLVREWEEEIRSRAAARLQATRRLP